ncbi:hypothetical protein AB1Y20_013230 [Prymnesium parvum]|uniref:Cyclic nucleotide-binding domain-containing protein n=1 Tax=Prymnesium parvum TaxID=97485 RepID=A0AB34IL04_PRYPA
MSCSSRVQVKCAPGGAGTSLPKHADGSGCMRLADAPPVRPSAPRPDNDISSHSKARSEGSASRVSAPPSRPLTRRNSVTSTSSKFELNQQDPHAWSSLLRIQAIFVLSLFSLAAVSLFVTVLRITFSDSWSALLVVVGVSTVLYAAIYLFGALQQRKERKFRAAQCLDEEWDDELFSMESWLDLKQLVSSPLRLDHPLNITVHLILATTLPLVCDLVAAATTGEERQFDAIEVVSLLRLLLLLAFQPAVESLTRNLVVPHHLTFAMSKLSTLCFTIHVVACLFWVLARSRDFDDNTWVGVHMPHLVDAPEPTQYLFSLYWATITASTVGYGDLNPVGDGEVVLTIAFVMVNIWLLAGIVGGISALASMEDTDMAQNRREIWRFEQMLSEERISPDVVVATREYLRLSLNKTKANIDTLPASVRQNIREQRFGDAVTSLHLLRGLSRRFVSYCVSRVHEDSFVAGLTILRAHDTPNRWCIILEGTAMVQVSKNQPIDESNSISHSVAAGQMQTVAVLHPGASFGAEGFVSFVRTPWAISARTMLRVLVLDEKDRRELERAFPNDWYKLRRNVQAAADELLTAAAWLETQCQLSLSSRERMKLRPFRMSLEATADVAPSTAAQFAREARELREDIARDDSRAMESLAALVCHLAGTGDDRELTRLIEMVPISEIRCDYDGRAGLHLAAAGGHDACIAVLLRHSADVNVVDRFGRTPLLEAVLNSRDDTISLLLEHGAGLGLEERQLASKLCDAACECDHALIRRYLKAGANPNAADYDRRTCLMLAASGGDFGICKLLIENDAAVDATDRWGHTALDEAVYHKHTGAICELLSNKPMLEHPLSM